MTEEEYELALLEISRLMSVEEGTPEFDRLVKLAEAVEKYERETEGP